MPVSPSSPASSDTERQLDSARQASARSAAIRAPDRRPARSVAWPCRILFSPHAEFGGKLRAGPYLGLASRPLSPKGELTRM